MSIGFCDFCGTALWFLAAFVVAVVAALVGAVAALLSALFSYRCAFAPILSLSLDLPLYFVSLGRVYSHLTWNKTLD